jgi:hypothetical protein
MFFKRNRIHVSIAYIHLSFNVSALRKWLSNPAEVGIDDNWVREEDQISHSIDFLVKDDLYFHRDANQFSHTVSGSHFVDKEIGLIEWRVIENYLFVVLENHKLIPCVFPLDEIRLLLKDGRTRSDNPKNDWKKGVVINIDEPNEYCKKVRKTVWLSYGLIYSNDIASLDFSVGSSSHFVDYSKTDN